MNSNTQNTKIKSITEKTLVVGIDVGSETHYARAFDWRNIELSSSPYSFSNSIDGFQAFLSWAKEIAADNEESVADDFDPTHGFEEELPFGDSEQDDYEPEWPDEPTNNPNH